MRLYREMQAAGLHADVYTLTALMTACERVGKWDTAVQLLSDLRSAGVPTNLHHHNCLLNAYGRAGCWQKVMAEESSGSCLAVGLLRRKPCHCRASAASSTADE